MLKRVSGAASREVAAADNVGLATEGMAASQSSNRISSHRCSNSEPSQLLLHKHGQIGMCNNLKAKSGAVACVNDSDAEAALRPFAAACERAAQALVSYRPTLSGALSPFAGVYDDVAFPVKTLFFPPTPPNMFPPRVVPPKVAATPVWKNDLRKAGPREHKAQVMISKIWRGISCRRQLRVARVYESVLNHRARVIQCWWRTTLARKRYTQLRDIKSLWGDKRTKDYIAGRLATMQNMMTWQRSRYDGAAMLLQRVVRWYLRERERERCKQMQDLPEAAWPPPLAFPIERKRVRYFPWRATRRRLGDSHDGGVSDNDNDEAAPGEGGRVPLPDQYSAPFGSLQADSASQQPVSAEALRALITGKRTLLQFKKTRELIVPVSWDYVQSANAVSKRRDEERARSLAHPFVQSRLEWKRAHLDGYDLDFTAGVIQRRYRSQRAAVKLSTAQLRYEYMDRVVRIISRTFKMYILIKRMKENRERNKRRHQAKMEAYTRERIEDIERQMVWGKELLDMSAATIQNYWHWYLYRTRGVMPKRRHTLPTLGDDADPEQVAYLKKLQEVTEPPSPPFHLIDAFMSKQNALRMESMNLIERNQLRRERSHRYTPYKPQKTNRYQIEVHLM